MGKIEELLVNKGLYDIVDITVDDLDEIEKCLTKDEYAGNTIDCFCVHCATNRVFEYTNSEVHEDTGIMRISVFDDGNQKVRRPKREEQFRRYLNKRYAMTYRCTRDRQHFIIFDTCKQQILHESGNA